MFSLSQLCVEYIYTLSLDWICIWKKLIALCSGDYVANDKLYNAELIVLTDFLIAETSMGYNLNAQTDLNNEYVEAVDK